MYEMRRIWCFLFFVICSGYSLALDVIGVARGMLPDADVSLSSDELKSYAVKAEQGDAESAYVLSCYYLKKGEGFYGDGYAWAAKSAAHGSACGMMNVGMCYYDGLGVEKDFQTAAQFFQRSLAAGNNRVLNALAHMFAVGEGVPQNAEKAYEYAVSAVESDVPNSLYMLAALHANGYGTPRDVSKAKELLREAIKRNPTDGDSYNALAVLLSQESENHWLESAPLFQKAADLGCSSAYLPLAHAYWKGKGLDKDVTRAAEYMQKAVASGDEEAYAYMADMYYDGEGVPRNLEMAEKWYRAALAHDMNDAFSCYSLALVRLEQANGTNQALVREAFELLQKSVQLGNPSAYSLLGYAYEHGWAFDGESQLPPDPVKARFYYEKAGETYRSEN